LVAVMVYGRAILVASSIVMVSVTPLREHRESALDQ
jgi:hypothetical protein